MNKTICATKEQLYIVESVLTNEGMHIINAYAGTGKTTTLVLISQAIAKSRKPDEKYPKIYYMCFNPSVAREAKKLFNSQVVTVGTPIDLAKEVLGHYEVTSDYTIAKIMDMENILYTEAAQVSELLREFFNSTVSGLDQIYSDAYSAFSRDIAQQIITDMKSRQIVASESFLIHMFQHLIAHSSSVKKYDYMLIDEAQDSSSAIANIIEKYPAKTKCLVGDINQRIYSFKGTLNALQLDNAHSHTLSKSFRYGENISMFAKHILSFYKNDNIDLEWTDQGKYSRNQACICYSNNRVIEYVVYCVDNNLPFWTFKHPTSLFRLVVHLFDFLYKGGSAPMEIQEIYSTYQKEYPNRHLERGDSLKEYIKISCAARYEGTNKRIYDSILCFEKNGDMKEYIDSALNSFSNPTSDAIVLGTAYDLKGQEFDRITIADDFPDIAKVIAKFYVFTKQTHDNKVYNFIEDFRQMIEKKTQYSKELDFIKWLDVVNLYYVACTRARVECFDKTVNHIYDSDAVINKQIRKHIRTYKKKEI